MSHVGFLVVNLSASVRSYIIGLSVDHVGIAAEDHGVSNGVRGVCEHGASLPDETERLPCEQLTS